MDNGRGPGGGRAVMPGASQAAPDAVIRPLSCFPKGLPSNRPVWFVAPARRCAQHRHRRGSCHADGRTGNAVLPGLFSSLLGDPA